MFLENIIVVNVCLVCMIYVLTQADQFESEGPYLAHVLSCPKQLA